jgi:hypothetical protein
MIISYFPKQVAIGSEPVLTAFLESCKKHNIQTVENSMSADAAVIWSVLWNGRMGENKTVWDNYRQKNKPVFVLEVGALQRGLLWKVGLNGINGSGYFGPKGMSADRRHSIKIDLKSWHKNQEIVICSQHPRSQQWNDMPLIDQWVFDNISKIRRHTDRKIVVRSHPRHPLKIPLDFKNVSLVNPRSRTHQEDTENFYKVLQTAYAIVNWNSNPSVIAAINGIPVFTGPDSLARDVGNLNLENINDPLLPDREQWANDLAYTEWTVEEISSGLPMERLLLGLTS